MNDKSKVAKDADFLHLLSSHFNNVQNKALNPYLDQKAPRGFYLKKNKRWGEIVYFIEEEYKTKSFYLGQIPAK